MFNQTIVDWLNIDPVPADFMTCGDKSCWMFFWSLYNVLLNIRLVDEEINKIQKLTITTIGLVFILLARAAYLRVLDVSERLDLAGETQAI